MRHWISNGMETEVTLEEKTLELESILGFDEEGNMQIRILFLLRNRISSVENMPSFYKSSHSGNIFCCDF